MCYLRFTLECERFFWALNSRRHEESKSKVYSPCIKQIPILCAPPPVPENVSLHKTVPNKLFILLFFCVGVCVCVHVRACVFASHTETVPYRGCSRSHFHGHRKLCSGALCFYNRYHTRLRSAHHRTAAPNETLSAVPFVYMTMTNEGGLQSLKLWRGSSWRGNDPSVPWF